MDTGRLNDVTEEEWDSTRCNRYVGINWTVHQEEEAHLADRAFNGASDARATYVGVEQEPWSGFFKGRSSAKFVPMTPEEAVAVHRAKTEGNPKKRIGALKAPMHLIPPVALAHLAVALGDGAEKYGPFNYRSEKVSASTYLGAIHRHLALYLDGEDSTADSGVHHIAAAMAGCAILLDCMAGGQLVDDRPPATGGVADVLNSYHKERSE